MWLANAANLYNDVEPYIWYAVAAVAWFALRPYAGVWPRSVLALSLIAFGTSDFFEAEAWWKPWWLLTWKVVAGITALGVIVYIIWRSRTKPRG